METPSTISEKKFWFFGSKLNTVLLLILIILMILALRFMLKEKETYLPMLVPEQARVESVSTTTEEKDTYTYKAHGFSIELPKDSQFIPSEQQAESDLIIQIQLPGFVIDYITDASWLENTMKDQSSIIGKQKIGEETFDIYEYARGGIDGQRFLYLKKGNIAYQIFMDENNEISNNSKKILETFKLIPQ